jgi:hypothetical protein
MSSGRERRIGACRRIAAPIPPSRRGCSGRVALQPALCQEEAECSACAHVVVGGMSTPRTMAQTPKEACP